MYPKNQCLDQQSIETGRPLPWVVPELMAQFFSAAAVVGAEYCSFVLMSIAEPRW
jgi:hypothetical protein